MKILSILSAVVLATGLAAADTADDRKPSIEAQPAQPHQFTDRYSRFRMKLKHPGLHLLALSQEKSALELFADDQGNDLRAQPSRRHPSGLEGRPAFHDAHLAHVEAYGKAAKGEAKTIRVKGTAVFLAASKTKRVRSEPSPFRAGETVRAGDYAFKVMGFLTQPDTPENSLERTVHLTLGVEDTAIAAIRFFDASGAPIEARRFGGGTSRVFGVLTVSLNYHLARVPERVRIEIDVWDDLQHVAFPFDFTQAIAR